MAPIQGILEKAVNKNCISRQEWEQLLDYATLSEEIVCDGDGNHLSHLISLLEGGVVAVDGVSQTEILRKLAVFA
ncbi:MAG TPA: hypothetical protein VJ955_08200 [Desulfuromonadales bacterium]|nr:hypothetical protein [Desulfuromonadales bacterium]